MHASGMGLHPDTPSGRLPNSPRRSGIIEGALVVYGLIVMIVRSAVPVTGRRIRPRAPSRKAFPMKSLRLVTTPTRNRRLNEILGPDRAGRCRPVAPRVGHLHATRSLLQHRRRLRQPDAPRTTGPAWSAHTSPMPSCRLIGIAAFFLPLVARQARPVLDALASRRLAQGQDDRACCSGSSSRPPPSPCCPAICCGAMRCPSKA